MIDYGSQQTYYQVYLNGIPVGIHSNPLFLIKQLRLLRRKGKINYMTSVAFEEASKCINIACDAGRPCRPLILVDQKTQRPMITQEDIYRVKNGEIAVTDLIKQGKMELIDVNEEQNTHIAISERDLIYGSRNGIKYTHMEIDPMTLFGLVAQLVPFPHHN